MSPLLELWVFTQNLGKRIPGFFFKTGEYPYLFFRQEYP